MEWEKIQKALAVEAERGFCDMVGRKSRFSRFMTTSLAQKPDQLSEEAIILWNEIAFQFSNYSDLSLFQRQQLLKHSKYFLQKARSDIEALINEGYQLTKYEKDYFDEPYDLDFEEYCLESIEYHPGLTTSQKIDLINGRRIEHFGRRLNFPEYLEFESDRDKFELTRENNYTFSLNWMYLKQLLECEEGYEFRDLVAKEVHSVRLFFPYFSTSAPSLDKGASTCISEIRLSKFICLNLTSTLGRYPRKIDYCIQKIALQFARYSSFELFEKRLLVEEAKTLFLVAQIHFELLPENRPHWVNRYNPYGYFDLPPDSLPLDESVDQQYVRKIKRYSGESVSVEEAATINHLLKLFFEYYERMPVDESEFHDWMGENWYHFYTLRTSTQDICIDF